MHAVHRLTIFADYFQFVVMDDESRDDLSSLWTPDALKRMLAVGVSVVCPGTLRNVDVPVEIAVVPSPPNIDLSKFDHAAEASIRVVSGTLAVMGCTGYLPDAYRIKVAIGSYQLLFLASGIDTIENEWEPADDLYTVYLWPGGIRPPRLLKHWKQHDA